VAETAGIGFIAAASTSNTAAAKAITTGTSSAAGLSIMAGPSTMAAIAIVVDTGFTGKQVDEVVDTLGSCTEADCIVGCFRMQYLAGSSIEQQTYLLYKLVLCFRALCTDWV
jgi:hypothetical protein